LAFQVSQEGALLVAMRNQVAALALLLLIQSLLPQEVVATELTRSIWIAHPPLNGLTLEKIDDA
tara:strand:+ start:1552 stop:1743 length:192 start_codon:yes stop_codon:yes gene_type:complete